MLQTVAAPVYAQDSGLILIPCDGPDCTYDHLIELAINVVDFLTGFSILLAVVGFIVAGFIILTAGPNPGKVQKGKDLLLKVGIGLFFVLAAWLIVNTITSTLFDAGFTLIK